MYPIVRTLSVNQSPLMQSISSLVTDTRRQSHLTIRFSGILTSNIVVYSDGTVSGNSSHLIVRRSRVRWSTYSLSTADPGTTIGGFKSASRLRQGHGLSQDNGTSHCNDGMDRQERRTLSPNRLLTFPPKGWKPDMTVVLCCQATIRGWCMKEGSRLYGGAGRAGTYETRFEVGSGIAV